MNIRGPTPAANEARQRKHADWKPDYLFSLLGLQLLS